MKHHRINDVIKSNNKILPSLIIKNQWLVQMAVKIYVFVFSCSLFKNGYDLRLAATLNACQLYPCQRKYFRNSIKKICLHILVS